MSCADPLPALMSIQQWTRTGKYVIAFSTKSERYREAHFQDGLDFTPFDMPCGKCSPCRKTAGRNKAILAQKEGLTHEKSCFITLTYRTENLPAGGALDRSHWQAFAKRFRERLRDYGHPPIRFFYCGEYGTKSLRPHFHALVYGYDFSADRKRFKGSGERTLYRSRELESLWTFGHSSIGSVTYASAAYVASYIVKKSTKHAERIKLANLPPEFARGSNYLGRAWLRKFYKDVYPGAGKSSIRIGNARVPPPKQFDRYLSEIDPARYADVLKKRRFDLAEKKAETVDLPIGEWLDRMKEVKRARKARQYNDDLKIERSLQRKEEI